MMIMIQVLTRYSVFEYFFIFSIYSRPKTLRNLIFLSISTAIIQKNDIDPFEEDKISFRKFKGKLFPVYFRLLRIFLFDILLKSLSVYKILPLELSCLP